MSKYLYLIRHAKSDWTGGLPDHERPLNHRGKRDAPQMASRLSQQAPQPEVLLSSPAQRALSTAQYFADVLLYPKDQIQVDEKIYEADVTTLLHIINTFDHPSNCLALFGHNPGISLFASYLSDGIYRDFPTCAVALFQFDCQHWAEISHGTGFLRWFSYPKLV